MQQPELIILRADIAEGLVEQGIKFWFRNNEHIRSPFPEEIKSDVSASSSEIFNEWIEGLTDKEFNEMNENDFVEMFETILFNEAMKLVEDEDQRLTISYPFLPRVGDIVNHAANGEGIVSSRKAVVSKENKKMMELEVSSKVSGNSWKTEFELNA